MGNTLHRGIDMANTSRNLVIHKFYCIHGIDEFGKTINNSGSMVLI